jgi:hypothetical protein
VFAAYFRRVRDAKVSARRVGYPRFKPYQRFEQVLFVAGDGARVCFKSHSHSLIAAMCTVAR